jgi:general secretion pathway protein I
VDRSPRFPSVAASRALSERERRRGLSLLEVLLSLAIFLVAMTGLSQLIANGVRASLRAKLETEAILRCESKLAEIVAGAEMFQSVSETPFPDDSAWVWSSTLVPRDNDLLYEIEVLVERKGAGDGRVRYALKRLAREPEILGAETTSTTSATE